MHLSIRTKNVLSAALRGAEITPEAVDGIGYHALLNLAGMGKNGFGEVVSWMHQCGYWNDLSDNLVSTTRGRLRAGFVRIASAMISCSSRLSVMRAFAEEVARLERKDRPKFTSREAAKKWLASYVASGGRVP